MTRLRTAAPFLLAVVAFACFWRAADFHRAALTPEQLRLLGWTCLALAAGVAWWLRPRAS